jgi:hypothetical protein
MKERNQSLNRFLARRELVRLLEKRSGQATVAAAEINRVRRQKSKRRKRSQLKYQ